MMVGTIYLRTKKRLDIYLAASALRWIATITKRNEIIDVSWSRYCNSYVHLEGLDGNLNSSDELRISLQNFGLQRRLFLDDMRVIKFSNPVFRMVLYSTRPKFGSV